MYTKAIELAEVSQLQPLDFIRLPIIAVFGYIFFSEEPTIWIWIGGAIIFLATAYVTHREAATVRQLNND
jgi:drug/metabolite transporter (DMT)-like permease